VGDPVEETTHSFVVRVWLEETKAEHKHATWGGKIKQLPDGPRLYVRDLTEITDFITVYLEQMGVVLSRWRKMRQWFGARRRPTRAGSAARVRTPDARGKRALLEDADDDFRNV
jgi:hypothetical protein